MPVGHKVHPCVAKHILLDIPALRPVAVADCQPWGQAGGHGDQPSWGGEVGGQEFLDTDAQVDRCGRHAGHEDEKLQCDCKDLEADAAGPPQLSLQPQCQVSEM